MNPYKKFGSHLILLLLVSTSLMACTPARDMEVGQEPSPTTNQIENETEPANVATDPVHEIYAGFSENKSFPFVMIHRSGESVVLTQDSTSLDITGAVWTSAEGESMVIYSTDDGKPIKAVVGDEVIYYSYISPDIADIRIEHSDGTVELFQAYIDTELLNKINSYSPPSFQLVNYSPSQFQPQNFYDWAKTALYVIGAVSCIVSVPGSFVVPIVGIPLLVKTCSGFLLGTVIRVGSVMNMDISDLQTFKGNLDIFKCTALKDPVSCLNSYIAVAEKQKVSADIFSPLLKFFATRTPLGSLGGLQTAPGSALPCDIPVPLGTCINNSGMTVPCGFTSDPVTGKQPTGNQVCQQEGKTCLYVSQDGGVSCSP